MTENLRRPTAKAGARPSRSSAAAIAGRCERRDPATGLNATERAFFEEVLVPLEAAGIIARIDFEPEGLRVGPPGTKAVYWPDFRIVWRDQVVEFLEVKGHWLDDARGKVKAAAALHPYTFRGVRRRPKREGAGWTFETFGPWRSWSDRIDELKADPERTGHP